MSLGARYRPYRARFGRVKFPLDFVRNIAYNIKQRRDDVMSEENKDEVVSIRVDRTLYSILATVAQALDVGISTAARTLLQRAVKTDPLVDLAKSEYPVPTADESQD